MLYFHTIKPGISMVLARGYNRKLYQEPCTKNLLSRHNIIISTSFCCKGSLFDGIHAKSIVNSHILCLL